jgi:hypothetical protein
VIPIRKNNRHFPEETALMSVVVVTARNVLNMAAWLLQEPFDVLVEPRFVPSQDIVHLG